MLAVNFDFDSLGVQEKDPGKDRRYWNKNGTKNNALDFGDIRRKVGVRASYSRRQLEVDHSSLLLE